MRLLLGARWRRWLARRDVLSRMRNDSIWGELDRQLQAVGRAERRRWWADLVHVPARLRYKGRA